MKRFSIFAGLLGILLFLSLFLTWNFSERIAIPVPDNPLWAGDCTVITSPLTEEPINNQFTFHTGRGAEADPDGICFGDFGSDEYWVIQYHADQREVEAYAWIIGINWIGHFSSSRRFSNLEKVLRRHLTQPAE